MFSMTVPFQKDLIVIECILGSNLLAAVSDQANQNQSKNNHCPKSGDESRAKSPCSNQCTNLIYKESHCITGGKLEGNAAPEPFPVADL